MAVVSNTCVGGYGSSCKVYLEYTLNSQSIENNTSNITLHLYAQATSTSVAAYNFNKNCKAYIKINDTTKQSSTTLNMDFRNKKVVDMLTWTGDISHNTDGKKTIIISGNFDTNGPTSVKTGSVSKEWTLTDIPRASTITCSDGYIGNKATITIKKANRSFTHTLTYSFLGLSDTIETKTTASTVNFPIPQTFYAKIPNSKDGSGTITCETYSGGTKVGTSTCNFKAKVDETINKPTISATVEDTNEKTITLTGDKNKLIKYFSNAKVVITATAKNSSTILERKVTCGNKTGTNTTSTLNAVESGTFALWCKDSRQLEGTNQTNKELIPYIKLAFTDIAISRPKTTSNTVNVKIKGNYYNQSFGAVLNTLTLKYRYHETGVNWQEGYTNLNATLNGNTFSYEASLGDIYDFKKEYEFEFVVVDKLMEISDKKIVTRGIPIIDIGKENVTINKQVYMGENKILSFDENSKNLVDADGNKHEIAVKEQIIVSATEPIRR